MIYIKEVSTKKELKKFITFPNSLYRNKDEYVKPLLNDEINIFSPIKNDAFSYCECKQFLAYNDKKIVGRIATIINHRYNIEKKVKQIRFTRFDVIDDIEVTKVLIDKVKEVATDNNLDEIIGPVGFCDLDYLGLLTKGFDIKGDKYNHYNYEYYQKHLKTLGFINEFDWNIYHINIPKEENYRQNQMSEFIIQRYNLKISSLKKLDNIHESIVRAIKLRNRINGHLYGYNQLTDKQLKFYSDRYKLLINLNYTYVLTNQNDEIIAFAFAAPIINESLLHSKSKINIFKNIILHRSISKAKELYLYSLIVDPKYQNVGLEQILINKLINVSIKKNIVKIITGTDIQYNINAFNNIEFIDKEMIKVRSSYNMKI